MFQLICFCEPTTSSPPTYRNIVIDVERHLSSAKPLTARREASSWHVTTSSVIGSSTFQARPSPSRTCVTAPKIYIGYAVHVGKDKLKCYPLEDKGDTKWIFSSENSGRRVLTVLTTYVSWIMTLPPTSPKNMGSAFRHLITRKIRSTFTPVSSIVGASIPSLPQELIYLMLSFETSENLKFSTKKKSIQSYR